MCNRHPSDRHTSPPACVPPQLRGRITVINGHNTADLTPYFPSTSLPAELGGSFPLDEAKWSEAMVSALPKE